MTKRRNNLEKTHQRSNRSYSNFEPDQGNNLETSAVLSLYENNGCAIEKFSVKEKCSNCDFLNLLD